MRFGWLGYVGFGGAVADRFWLCLLLCLFV